MLNFIEHDGPRDGPPIVIAHGLFGSARNWGVIAKRLSSARRVVVVDHRNHGHSPWAESHRYHDLVQDLAEVIEHIGAPCDLVGHSMGGKAAMVLAVTHPEIVARLCIADIAPVPYDHDQSAFIHAMKSVDFSTVHKRSDVKDQLANLIDDPVLQTFFVQSVDIENKCWRLNLDVLAREMPHILGFPNVSGRFEKLTLFLTGADSHYVQGEVRPLIKSMFPQARFAKLLGAGHWLHADKPREFEAALRSFFGAEL